MGEAARGRGRPTKYSAARHELIIKAIRAGNTRASAAAHAGVTSMTIVNWIRRRPEFRDDVIAAEAECEIQAVGVIQDAALKDWRAAKWWLERRCQENWGQRSRLEVTGKDGRPLVVEIKWPDR